MIKVIMKVMTMEAVEVKTVKNVPPVVMFVVMVTVKEPRWSPPLTVVGG